MNLELKREPSDSECTISRLFVDGIPECWILEDIVRPVKIACETAIPVGKYQVLITWSPRFKQRLPLLVGVPGFDGVRIHPGNNKADTSGCLLPGQFREGDSVGNSRRAFDNLFPKIQAALDKGESVSIDIIP